MIKALSKARNYTAAQLPVVAFWWLKRKARYLIWGFYNRVSGPLKFSKIGKGVIFNGPVRIEHPFSKISIGDYSMVGVGCYFLARHPSYLSIGKGVTINDHCYITSCYGIEIGDNVSIAEHVSIRDYNHEFSDPNVPISHQGLSGAPIKIGDDVWLGRGVMVSCGVTIGKGCVVGANAVVTKSLPDYSIAVGVPARVIKSRKPEEVPISSFSEQG
jgi:acetyltransferase-like isoleucine patch superfamily enzyme